MTTKLTKRVVDRLAPRDRPFIAFDAEVKGFGCRIAPNGAKTFVLEYRPGVGGRGVAKSRLTLGRYGTITVEQARQAALLALARVRLGADPQADKARQREDFLTIAALIDRFVAEHVGKLKAGTAVGYKIALDKLRTAHGKMNASHLTRAHLATMHAKMADGPYGANRFLAVVSILFAWAIDRGLLPEGHTNPAARIDRFKEQSRERYLTREEFARLRAALRMAESEGLSYDVDETKPGAKHAAAPENRCVKLDPYAIAAIYLLIMTGARLREILHAQWSQVDFERGVIFLPDSKTGKKPIFLNSAAVAILHGLPRLADNPYVIPGQVAGQPRADLKKPWATVTRAAGLDGLRIHDLRHSFASIGAAGSLGLPIIGKLLGHSQAATTQRYAHLADVPMHAAAEAIGAAIQAAMNSDDKTAEVETAQ